MMDHLMEEVCQRDNLNQAYCRVKANKGAPGIDGLTVDELLPWIAGHKQELLSGLLDGSYRPQAVRGVSIPKPGGGASVSWGFRRWWIVWFNRRYCRC